jgi:PPE-repeat protein
MLYGALPPEVNSGRMYAGPGAGSMLAAAAAWDVLAVELSSAAMSCQSVIAGLISGPWLGASATMMAAATAPYVAWLHGTAAEAERAAGQAKAAAAAYETARAMTVPPVLVAANRAQLMALIATNFLGQNTPAIAVTEALYGEMWAQDAAAMYCYAAASAAATTLTPFGPAPQIADPVGPAGQAGGVIRAAAGSVATDVADVLSQLTRTVPSLLADFAGGPPQLPQWVQDVATVMNIFGTPFFVVTSAGGLMVSFVSAVKSLVPAAAQVGTQVVTSLGSAAGPAGSVGLTGAVSAGLGRAESVGALSAPRAWGTALPTLSPEQVAALPGAVMNAAPAAGANAPGLFGGLPAASDGRAQGAGNSAQDGITPLRVLPDLIG